MPVVAGLQVEQAGTAAGRVYDPAAGRAGQGHPCLELGIHRVGIVAIVEHLVVGGAAGYHQVVEAAPLERDVGAAAQFLHVGGIQQGGIVGGHGEHPRGRHGF